MQSVVIGGVFKVLQLSSFPFNQRFDLVVRCSHDGGVSRDRVVDDSSG
jgi:hypothetical protein